MKKLTTLTALMIAAVMLTGCSADTYDSIPEIRDSAPVLEDSVVGGFPAVEDMIYTPDDDKPEDILHEEETEESAPPAHKEQDSAVQTLPVNMNISKGEPAGAVAELTFPLYGLNGDKISPEDITDINSALGGMTAEKLTDKNWSTLICEDITYLAQPTGAIYNSASHPDMNWSRYIVGYSSAEYQRYNVGDEICGLTLTSAQAHFSTECLYSSEDITAQDKYFCGGSAEFEGTAVLTGRICLGSGYEDNVPNHIGFFPESGELPVMNYSRTAEGIKAPLQREYPSAEDDIYFADEYPVFQLGYTNSYPHIDFSEVPTDGSMVKVKITIENISMVSVIGQRNSIVAEIAELEIID